MTRHDLKNILSPASLLFAALIISGFSAETSAQGSESNLVKLTKCSAYPVENPVAGALAADDQRVYVGTADGSVLALDINVSSSVWRTELGGAIVSNIVVSETGALVISNPANTAESVPTESILRSISKETGVPNWKARLPFSGRFYLGRVNGSIAAVSLEGVLASFDAQSGRSLWRTQTNAKITVIPTFSMHGIAFGTADKQIFVVSSETGDVIFKGATEFVPTAITMPSPEIVVVGDERGNVASISIPGGKAIWKFKSGAAVSFVSIAKEGLVATSLDNFIYLIWMYNGDVIWKRRLPGRITEGVIIVEGFVTALIYGENSAFLIDSKKGKIVDQLSPSARNFVNQVPVLARDSTMLVTTPDAVIIYGLKGCEQKIGEAASKTPPLTKQ